MGARVTFRCFIGYTVRGVATSECRSGGTWSSPVPECRPNVCAMQPAGIFQGSLSFSRPFVWAIDILYIDGTVHYTCDPGFAMQGEHTRMCVPGPSGRGVLTGETPRCVRVPCPVPQGVRIWRPSVTAPWVGELECPLHEAEGAVRAVCRDGGWDPPLGRCVGARPPCGGAVDANRTFSWQPGSEGAWVPVCTAPLTRRAARAFSCADLATTDVCRPVQCPHPAPGAYFAPGAPTDVAATLEVRCVPGAHIAGAPFTATRQRVACVLGSGQDDVAFLVPRPAPCTPIPWCTLPPVANGAWGLTHVLVGDTVPLSCNPGFINRATVPTTCTAPETLDRALPECDAFRRCAVLPPPIGNGSHPLIILPVGHGVEIGARCNPLYARNGTFACADGVWVFPGTPLCVPAACELDIDHAVADAWAAPGGQTRIACEPGFELVGPDVVTCRANGTWTPTPPACVVASCTIPPFAHGTSPLGKVFVGEVYVVECDDDHEPDTEELECLDTGELEAVPECV